VRDKPLYVIGLTGNIATGKTAVATMLAERGAQVIDADQLAHEAMGAGTPTWQRAVAEFGNGILLPDGEIDRGRLGALVFADPDALQRLETIVHPAVMDESNRRLDEHHAEATSSGVELPKIVVLEAIKLIESGMYRRCDEVWVVTSSRQQQVQRLVAARNLTFDEANLRIDAQAPQAEKLALADVRIDNNDSLARTQAQVTREWRRILREHRQPPPAPEEAQPGGHMSSWRKFVDEHPFLTMWAVLAVGMVAIFLVTSRNVDLLPSQRLFMALACVGTAGLCTWIISWE